MGWATQLSRASYRRSQGPIQRRVQSSFTAYHACSRIVICYQWFKQLLIPNASMNPVSANSRSLITLMRYVCACPSLWSQAVTNTERLKAYAANNPITSDPTRLGHKPRSRRSPYSQAGSAYFDGYHYRHRVRQLYTASIIKVEYLF